MPVPNIRCGEAMLDRPALLANVAKIAGGLALLGLAPGDRVAIILKNSIEFIEITLGAGRAGVFAVPINWHFTATEVDALLEDCAPQVIFVHEDLRSCISPRWLSGVPVIAVGINEATSDYVTWRNGSPVYEGPERPAPGSIVYTSGTTGRPKGVKRALPTPKQQTAMRTVRSEMYRTDSSSRVLVPGPLYHAFPSQFATNAALTAEHTEIMPRFCPEALLAVIEREKITSVALAPIMFVRLLRLTTDVRNAYDLSSLRWAIHAGGPCAEDVKREMIDWWGPIIAEYYGGTETGPLTLCTSVEWLAHPGTCGKPMPSVELRVVDSKGRDVPRGEPGEIFGRLSSYPDFTYHNDPEKRQEVGLGSLVSLGDVGYQDSEGYLYLCDRARDMVVSGGVNIYPAEVEKALFALPGVHDCAAFGIPDPEFGETLVAFVVGEGLDGEELRKSLRISIAGYKVPKAIVTMMALERDASGKIRKHLLRERYLEMTGVSATDQQPAV